MSTFFISLPRFSLQNGYKKTNEFVQIDLRQAAPKYKTGNGVRPNS